jgi:RNA polymerase-binding protein DksA
MKKTDLQRYRGQLETLRSRMRSEANAVAQQARSASSGHAAGELSNAPYHLADIGTEEFLHDMNAALVENEQRLVNEVRAALERMEQGAYGLCERCGKPVAKARLDAMPYARFCIKCAEASDQAIRADVH